ncbi:hypothetical protein [Hyphococcus sp. DH-69]|uniref:hypothetical protein n=1 Tax=Hyphococcus formosus TaxID=3143534 RepID=UPI00398A5B3F
MRQSFRICEIALGTALCSAASSPGGRLNNLPPDAFYSVASAARLFFVFDVLYSIKGPPSEQRRLTRHGWRMGFSFFLATGSFFFGNNHVLPEALRTPLFLSAPVLLVILWTFYFSVKARFLSIGRKV